MTSVRLNEQDRGEGEADREPEEEGDAEPSNWVPDRIDVECRRNRGGDGEQCCEGKKADQSLIRNGDARRGLRARSFLLWKARRFR